MDTNWNAKRFVSIEGIWRLLISFAGVSAEERGQGTMDPIDILVAIYVVDLEHVANLWDDWTQLETLVLSVPVMGGRTRTYLNRHEYMFRVWSAAKQTAGTLTFYPSPSAGVVAVAEKAQELARARNEERIGVTSLDCLYSICLIDAELSEALLNSGLNLQKLELVVRTPRRM